MKITGTPHLSCVYAWDQSHVYADPEVRVYRRSAEAIIQGGIVIDAPAPDFDDPR